MLYKKKLYHDVYLSSCRRLYWSDWGTNKPKIESSDLDGSKRKVLVDYELQWPNGIALDYHNRHLYWVDAGTDKIEYYDLSKKTRNRLPKAGSPHAFGISILGEMVYWTDWQKRSLYQFNKETKKLSEVFKVFLVICCDYVFLSKIYFS